MQQIIYSQQISEDLDRLCREMMPDRIFVLTDGHTRELCLPLLKDCPALSDAVQITIGNGDAHKDIHTLTEVWKALGDGSGSRHSLLINLGGGMVTDLGGFAAATFKRGIAFINIPTTVLAMVDAAVGGKTGINFHGLKNEIGAFREAEAVIICTDFLRTLDHDNLCSGYAEMLKHALLESPGMLADHLRFDLSDPDYPHLQTLVRQSIGCKQRIVAEDPHEHGIRKALNLGHTIGHALESLALQRKQPVLHGYAVAWGLVCELYLSAVECGFPTDRMRQIVQFVKAHYGAFPLSCNDYPGLYETMLHDKKNKGGIILFTLVRECGEVRINQVLSRETVYESLDFLREG